MMMEVGAIFEKEQIAQIKENARVYNIGDRIEAFIQFSGDQDFYRFTVPHTAIYQFSFATPDDMTPSALLFEYDEKKTILCQSTRSTRSIG
ncbi:hypothetical protein [Anoxybacillus sp. KU2-6(11)]|uniref:hypothetical protein n=1 Tax=Anoxybacillus sp. KU2-6(11) TaxID=1535751 RepID=UPI001E3FD589|nr:hypothetical protein [Anoxybacillus sp. KU2-6(11)]